MVPNKGHPCCPFTLNPKRVPPKRRRPCGTAFFQVVPTLLVGFKRKLKGTKAKSNPFLGAIHMVVWIGEACLLIPFLWMVPWLNNTGTFFAALALFTFSRGLQKATCVATIPRVRKKMLDFPLLVLKGTYLWTCFLFRISSLGTFMFETRISHLHSDRGGGVFFLEPSFPMSSASRDSPQWPISFGTSGGSLRGDCR